MRNGGTAFALPQLDLRVALFVYFVTNLSLEKTLPVVSLPTILLDKLDTRGCARKKEKVLVLVGYQSERTK